MIGDLTNAKFSHIVLAKLDDEAVSDLNQGRLDLLLL